jgi:hypothetical protein
MALVPCRECGKEVSDEAKTCQYCGIKTPCKKRRQRRLIITAIIICALVGLSAWGYHRINQDPAPDNPQKATPKIQKTIPVKEQILQKDYKEKVGEMLDSGKTPREVRNETGLSLPEIKKIKKEKKEKEAENK